MRNAIKRIWQNTAAASKRLSGGIRQVLASWEHAWLSDIVKREMRDRERMLHMQNLGLEPNCFSRWVQRNLKAKPSIPFVFLGVLLLQMLFAVLYVVMPCIPIPHGQWGDLVSVLWQVEASILSITFVVAVLLVELRADKASDESLFRFYIEESGIVSVAMTGLAVVLVAGLVRLLADLMASPRWGWGLAFSCVLTFALFVLSTAWLYRRTLTFLQPAQVRQTRMKLATREAASGATNAAVHIRADYALRLACEKMGLFCSPFGAFRQELAPIRANHMGQVVDVDLAALSRFVRALQNEAVKVDSKSYKALLVAEMGASLREGEDILARVHPSDTRAEVARLLRRAFKVVQAPIASPDPLISALQQVRNDAIAAIRDRNVAAFEEAERFYTSFFRDIVNLWHLQGLPLETLSSPLGDLGRTPIHVVLADLYDLERLAIESRDTDMIGRAMSLPIQVLPIAVGQGETQLFGSLARIVIEAYGIVAVEPAGHARDSVVGRSWRYLVEFAHYALIEKIESDLTAIEDITRLGAYLDMIASALNQLLKAAVDSQDKDSFTQFGAALDQLLQTYRPDTLVPDAEILEWQLQEGRLAGPEKEKAEAGLARYKALEQVQKLVQSSTHSIWFGISAWLVRQLRAGRISWPAGSAMLVFARGHFTSLAELSTTYFGIITKHNNQFGWVNWVLDELPKGAFHWVNTGSWMQEFYCIQGLRLSPDTIGAEGTDIVPDREVEFVLESLEKTCEQLRERGEAWKEIILDSDLAKTDSFLELHRRAMRQARRQHEQETIRQPISQEKWTAFRHEFIEGLRDNATIRAILTEFGVIESRPRDPTQQPVPPLGIDMLAPKAAFVEDPYVKYWAFGKDLGRQIAISEDSYLLPKIVTAVPWEETCRREQMFDCTEGLIQAVKDRGYTPDVILIDHQLWFSSLKPFPVRGFIYRQGNESLNVPGLQGRLRTMPVITIASPLLSGILVADFSALGCNGSP